MYTFVKILLGHFVIIVLQQLNDCEPSVSNSEASINYGASLNHGPSAHCIHKNL